MATTQDLAKEKASFITQVLNLDYKCVGVLLDFISADAETITRSVKRPLISSIGNQSLEQAQSFQAMFSTKRSACVVVMIGDVNKVKLDCLETMLFRTSYRKVFIFLSDGGEEDIKSAFAASYLTEDIIFVRWLSRARFHLSSKCLTSKDNVKTMIWKTDENTNPGFETLLCSSRSLRGRTDVMVSLYPLLPFVIYQPKHRYTGAELTVFNMVAAKIGFTYRVREEPNWTQQNNVTGKWEGIVGSVMNRSSHFGFSALPIYRQEDSSTYPLDFSPLLYTFDNFYLTPKLAPISPFLNFLKPFTSEVWAALFVTFLVCSVLSYALIRFRQTHFFNEDKPIPLWKIVFDLYGTLWAQNLNASSSSPSISIFYIIYGAWIVAILFKGSSYFVNLRTFIIKIDYEQPIETDEDVVRLDRDVYFPREFVSHSLYLHSSLPVKRGIAERALRRDTVFSLRSGDMTCDVQERMVRDKACRLSFEIRRTVLLHNTEKCFNGFQPLRAAKTIVITWNIGFAMPMHQPWSQEVSSMLLWINNYGLVDHLIKKFTPLNKYSLPEESVNLEKVLEPYKFEHVAGPLLILAGGLGLAILAFCHEFHLERVKRAVRGAMAVMFTRKKMIERRRRSEYAWMNNYDRRQSAATVVEPF